MILARQRTDLTIANTGFLNNVLHIHLHLHREREPQSTPPSVCSLLSTRTVVPRLLKPSSHQVEQRHPPPTRSQPLPPPFPSSRVYLAPSQILLCNQYRLEAMPLLIPSRHKYRSLSMLPALICRVPFKSCVVTDERGALVAIVGAEGMDYEYTHQRREGEQ